MWFRSDRFIFNLIAIVITSWRFIFLPSSLPSKTILIGWVSQHCTQWWMDTLLRKMAISIDSIMINPWKNGADYGCSEFLDPDRCNTTTVGRKNWFNQEGYSSLVPATQHFRMGKRHWVVCMDVIRVGLSRAFWQSLVRCTSLSNPQDH